MNNRERVPEAEAYHILIALRRKKENRELQELCFRQIVRDYDTDLAVLKARVARIPGIWRIYQTVNKRAVEPARKLLMKHLIDEPDKFVFRIDSLWKNCLLQKCCRYERKFMIDIDMNWEKDKLDSFIKEKNLLVEEIIKTPNGYHIICPELDTRKLQEIAGIEVKRDDIYFIERFEIK